MLLRMKKVERRMTNVEWKCLGRLLCRSDKALINSECLDREMISLK